MEYDYPFNKATAVAEAIRRLQTINVSAELIGKLIKDEQPIFECGGVLSEVPEEFQQYVDIARKETDYLLYYVMYSETQFGTLLSFLYVTKYRDEWEMDMEDLCNEECMIPVAYVYNISAPDLSEFGHIGVKPLPDGGIYRVS